MLSVAVSETCDFCTMLKVRVHGFDRIGCLVTSSALNSGKGDTVTTSDPFTDPSYTGHTLHCDSTHRKLNGTVKASHQ